MHDISYEEMIAEARKLVPHTWGDQLQGLTEWIWQLNRDWQQLQEDHGTQASPAQP